MLAGNNDPWMFHQANTRDYGGGHSLLGDLLGATLDQYLAAATFPILSPTMDELAVRVLDRMPSTPPACRRRSSPAPS